MPQAVSRLKYWRRFLQPPTPEHSLSKTTFTSSPVIACNRPNNCSRLVLRWARTGRRAIGDAKTLKKVFDARNQIIHELDMNLDSPNRKRRVRSQKDMKEYSERLLRICYDIIHDVGRTPHLLNRATHPTASRRAGGMKGKQSSVPPAMADLVLVRPKTRVKKFFIILGSIFLAVIVLGGIGIAFLAIRGSALDKESKAYADLAIPADCDGLEPEGATRPRQPRIQTGRHD